MATDGALMGTRVCDLLEASRRFHRDYRRYAGSTDKDGKVTQPYDEVQCQDAVKAALETRQEADKLDPKHKDPAWQLDQAPHKDLVKFYRQFLRSERIAMRQAARTGRSTEGS